MIGVRKQWARDSQRNALYKWERRPDVGIVRPISTPGPSTPMEQCVDLARRIWEAWAPGYLPPVLMHAHRNRDGACYRWTDHTIHLNDWARQPGVVAHETAHAVFHHRTIGSGMRPFEYADHGPEFARLYCEIAVQFLGHSMARLVHGAENPPKGQRKVKIAGLNDLPWRIAARIAIAA